MNTFDKALQTATKQELQEFAEAIKPRTLKGFFKKPFVGLGRLRAMAASPSRLAQLYAITDNGEMLQYVKNQTEEVCLTSVLWLDAPTRQEAVRGDLFSCG